MTFFLKLKYGQRHLNGHIYNYLQKEYDICYFCK